MRKTIRKVLRVLTARERRTMVLLFFLMLVSAVFQSLSVAVVIPFTTSLLNPGELMTGRLGRLTGMLVPNADSRSVFHLLVIAMILIFVIKNAYSMWQKYYYHKVTARIRRRVQHLLLHSYLKKPYAYFINSDSGDILRTVTVDSDYFLATLNHLLTICTNVTVTFFLFLVIIAIDFRLTLLSVCLLGIEYLIILRLIRPFLRKHGKRYREALGRGNSLIIETLRGVKTIKVSGKESFIEKRYAGFVDKLAHAQMIERSFSSAPQYFMEAMTVSALLVLLLAAYHAQSDLTGIIPTLSAFGVAVFRIMPDISAISSAVSYIGYYEGSVSRVEQICCEPVQEETGEKKADRLSFDREIRMEGITFSYHPENAPVLQDASFTVPCGKRIGIQGTSGRGKTTLVDILLGLLQPQAGTVLLDGVVRHTDTREWQNLFAYVPQNVFMMAGTIRENIVFGEEEKQFDPERFRSALETAQLTEFVDSLPEGTGTDVGEAGVRLSGGQIQRLGIARALYADAPVVILDEATSALDPETESAVLNALSGLQGRKTIIMITHKQSAVRDFDLLYTVENQKVILKKQD